MQGVEPNVVHLFSLRRKLYAIDNDEMPISSINDNRCHLLSEILFGISYTLFLIILSL